MAQVRKPAPASEKLLPAEKVATPGVETIEALATYLHIPTSRTAKAVFFMATLADSAEADTERQQVIFAVVRGDMELNETKLVNALAARDLRPAHEDEIRAIGAEPGYASPIDLGQAGVLVVVDDSHGVGAFGATGRGTEEQAACGPVDVLMATLGKAFGVNGGYVTANGTIIDYLRETSPFYIYSNPITPGEAAAAARAVDILDSAEGRRMVGHLAAMTRRFEDGLRRLGHETIPGEHPVVPLMVRDTARTSALVAHLHARGVLATGLNYPVVPRGDEEIRFQISADHTPADIDEALQALEGFPG